MNIRPAYQLPVEIQQLRRRAIRLEWITLLVVSINIGVLYLVLGNSQAMHTAWIEDVMALIPPLAFLVATHFETKTPTERNPYGFFRAIDIAYLCTALALLAFGLVMFYKGVKALMTGTHPTIGTMVVFGEQIWLGWLMIAALTYSAIPPVIVGLLKLSVARKLHDKVLRADADMNKADWMTSMAGIIGVVGIGVGLWWLDAVAAIIISCDIMRDGFLNTKRFGEDLLDTIPRQMGSKRKEALLDKVMETLRQKHWIADAQARMREEGHVFSGEATVVLKDVERAEDLVEHLQQAREEILRLDWRLYDFNLTPVRSIKNEMDSG